MKKSPIALFLLIISSQLLKAQDPQFSQFYSAPLSVNPAFAGTTTEHRLIVNSRIQWPSLPKAYVTHAFSYDFNMHDLNSGIGVLFSQDKAGQANLSTTSASFSYTYNVRLNKQWVLKPALSFGYVARNIDLGSIVLGDQLDARDPTSVVSIDPALGSFSKTQYLDLGTGFLLYNGNSWLGASALHLNQPNQSFIEGDSPLPIRYSVHGGVRIKLGKKSLFKGVKHGSLSPAFVYKTQGTFEQLDLGVNFHFSPIVVGLWYRGVPISKNLSNNLNQDAIVFLVGLQFQSFEFAYSYDFSISKLAADSGGSHEFSLAYRFTIPENPGKVRKKIKFQCVRHSTLWISKE